MFELVLLAQLLTPAERSDAHLRFCADVVGVPYASDNFTFEEWKRFQYCREHIRAPQK